MGENCVRKAFHNFKSHLHSLKSSRCQHLPGALTASGKGPQGDPLREAFFFRHGWGSGDGRAKGRKGKRMEGQGVWRKLFRSGRGDGGCGYKKEAGNLVGYLPRVLFCFKYFA
ncbi:hypothetical protein HMPREF1548_04891 [Clostridium sp. KLE 1755]|nr:hypothetical protein HMPREF1548_04891 [Clostridium sp. KLE 1755]